RSMDFIAALLMKFVRISASPRRHAGNGLSHCLWPIGWKLHHIGVRGLPATPVTPEDHPRPARADDHVRLGEVTDRSTIAAAGTVMRHATHRPARVLIGQDDLALENALTQLPSGEITDHRHGHPTRILVRHRRNVRPG